MRLEDARTVQRAVQELHHVPVIAVLLSLVLWRAEEVAGAEDEVELAVLRVDGFDFGEEVADGADC